MRLANFQIGAEIKEAKALEAFNNGKERVKVYGSTWVIAEFIPFQYGKLNPEKMKFHKTIENCVNSLENKVSDTLTRTLSGRVTPTLQDKAAKANFVKSFHCGRQEIPKFEILEPCKFVFPGFLQTFSKNVNPGFLQFSENISIHNGFLPFFIGRVLIPTVS